MIYPIIFAGVVSLIWGAIFYKYRIIDYIRNEHKEIKHPKVMTGQEWKARENRKWVNALIANIPEIEEA